MIGVSEPHAPEPDGSSAKDASARPATPMAPAAKQAVILVHGMGEQRPMDTIKGFVRAVWETDAAITRNGLSDPAMVWSKPDARTGSLELRRLTTRESIPSEAFPGGVRTDFFELYWADLTAGSTWDQVTSWICYLLLRPWSAVPPPVRLAWLLLWVLTAAVAATAIISVLPDDILNSWMPRWAGRWLLVVLAGAVLKALHEAATSTFGRVIRYTVADPANIAARAAVRKRGLDLIDGLNRDKEYKRIILVGHSLGSILAYELLSFAWAQHAAARTLTPGTPEFEALCALESAAAAWLGPDGEPMSGQPTSPPNDYREAQRRLRTALASRPSPAADKEVDRRWIITDFVTLGSPLTHSEFLLASGKSDLKGRQAAREMPTAPALREVLDPQVLKAAQAAHALPIANPPSETRLLAFPSLNGSEWILHHATPFAAIRWTNIYDPSRAVILGDVISGPLAPVFGAGIADINLAAVRGPARRFSHTDYWSDHADPRQIEELRKAVNILDA